MLNKTKTNSNTELPQTMDFGYAKKSVGMTGNATVAHYRDQPMATRARGKEQ